MKQASAVVKATMEVLSDLGIDFTNEAGIKEFLKGLNQYEVVKTKVTNLVTDMIYSGECDMNQTSKAWADHGHDRAQLAKKYVSGMVDNHWRKHKDLNGGTKYEAKNPGSRSKDPQLVEANKMLKVAKDDEQRATIQAFIDQRTAELAASKRQPAAIIEENVPAELQHLLGEIA